MNNKFTLFIKNISYTITSNLTTLLISTLITLFVPKLIGVTEYGYWQLYLFYSSYVGFFQFGWNDGIYLRYGGEKYEELNKKLLFSQFWLLFLSQFIIGIIFIIIMFAFGKDGNLAFIIYSTAICLIIVGTRALILFILQATNRIADYARITVLGQVSYFLLIAIFLLIGAKEYRIMIVGDIIGKLISFIYALYICRDIVFNKISSFYIDFKEIIENINVGIKLMFSNIASMLIIGVVRFGIERQWDVETFGKVSLTLSISNMMMIFINAVGVIMFPILRRSDEKKLSEIYSIMRDILMVLLLGLLIVYYPFKIVLSLWLPEYAEALKYMAIVFPVFIYEGKMSLLINTYLKTLRKEKILLLINLFTVLISFLFTLITTLLLKNLNFTVLTILILVSVRVILAEFYISKIMKLDIKRDIVFEFMLTIIFIASGWYINSWYTVAIYGASYVIYLILKRKELSKTFNALNLIIKK